MIQLLYNKSISAIHENGHSISLFSIAIPKFLELIFIQLISTVNMLMLSGYSESAVAAVSVSWQIENLIVIILNIITSGMTIVMSVELGKNNREKASEIAGSAFFLLTAISLFTGIICCCFSEKLITLMNLSGTELNMAKGYFGIRMIFLFIITLNSYFSSLLICNGYAGKAVTVGICSNILNALGCYIILYTNFSLPIEKVVAVAYASIIAQLISMLLAIVFIRKSKCPFKLKFKKNTVKKILKIGTPSGLGLVSYSFTQVITTSFVASLGIMTLNANVYITSIIAYTSKISWAIAQGNGVLIGRYRGRGDFDSMKLLHRQNMKIAVLSNFTLSLIVFVFHRQLISIFTKEPQIIMIAGGVMLADIMVETARAVNHISELSLNANGDVKTTFVVPLITCWLFGVLASYILGIKCGLGLLGCWIGFALDEVTKGTIYLIRWKTEKWKNTNI